MHAALVNLTIEPDQAPAAANALTHDILPTIRSAPGFVGYWLEPVDGHGFSFVVFETEEQDRFASRRRAVGSAGACEAGRSGDGGQHRSRIDGGADVRENMHAAHRSCNSRPRRRGREVQGIANGSRPATDPVTTARESLDDFDFAVTATLDTDAEGRYADAVARRDAIRDAWKAEGSPLLTSGSTGQLVEHPFVKMLRLHDVLVDRLAHTVQSATPARNHRP